MKWLIYVFIIIFCSNFISRCDLPSNELLKQQKKESYQACMDLKRKAPFIKLNCQKLLENIPTINSAMNEEDNGIKTLSKTDSETRKVNEMQEKKLKVKFKRKNKIYETDFFSNYFIDTFQFL